MEFKPYFVKGSTKTVRVKGRGSFVLDCTTNENPPANIKWLYGAGSVKDLKTIDEKSSILKRNNMRSSMKGFYQCIVENSIGKTSQIFTVYEQASGKKI